MERCERRGVKADVPQFLNSVLSSIGGAGIPVPVSTVTTDVHGNLSSSSGDTKSKNPSSSQGPTASKVTITKTTTRPTPAGPASNLPRALDLKRKAEELPVSSPAKIPRVKSKTFGPTSNAALPSHSKARTSGVTDSGTPRPLSRPATPSAGPASTRILGGKVPVPSRADKPATKPIPQDVHPRATSSTPSTTGQVSKAPAKGSYKEIMARAEAAKAAQADFGQIKHKTVPIPKLSRRARAAQDSAVEPATGLQKGKIGAKPGTVGRGLDGLNVAGRSPVKGSQQTVEERKKKPPVDLGYKGTMRAQPQAMGYKGGVRERSTTLSRAAPQTARGPVPKRPPDVFNGEKRYVYASGSDEEDEEEEDYDDESDGMEGGGFDELMAEEEESERVAKKEDMEAQRELDALNKAKAERRKKLEQLASSKKR